MAKEPVESNDLTIKESLAELKTVTAKVAALEGKIEKLVTVEHVTEISEQAVQQVNALSTQLTEAIQSMQAQVAGLEFAKPQDLVEIRESLNYAKAEHESLTGIVRTLVEKKPGGSGKPTVHKRRSTDKHEKSGFGPPLIS